jgi:hypothetical protein
MAGDNKNARIWRDSVSVTKDCPPVEVLEHLIEQTASDPRLAAHVSDCPHCQTEMAMLRSFESSTPSTDEGGAVAWITAQLERNRQATAATAPRPVVPFWRSLFQLPYVAAAAVLIAAITLGISFYNSNNGQPGFVFHGAGTTYRGEIHLNPPSNLSQPPEQLSWEAVPGAVRYSVEIADVTGDKIWQSSSMQSFIRVDPVLKSKMLPGKPLKWTVTALDAKGKELATGKADFRVAGK